MITRVKTATEITAMKESGRMLASVLQLLATKTVPGVTTKKLAEIASQELKSLGGKPAFLGYQGFPDVLCVSINDEVVHGIPSSHRTVENGDIVSLDFGVVYRGMITDSAISLIAGWSSFERQKLVDITKTALNSGIKAVKSGIRVGAVSAAVGKTLDAQHYGIVRDLVGHGVGHELHEEPNIPNFGNKQEGLLLQAGMTIAIEPMATLGDYRVYISDDGWTVRTVDGSLAAHFEHTVLVTDSGAEIMTII